MTSASHVRTSKTRELPGVPNHRFACQNMEIEWTLTDADGINYIISQLLLNIASWSAMNQGIRKVQNVANHNSNMLPVRHLLETARRTNDIKYLLKAYTVECDFYKTLNRTLAERVGASNMGNPITSLLNLLMSNEDDKTPDNDWPLCFVGPIFDDIFSTDHSRYQYTGRTYRGACISQGELSKYVVGKLLFNKAFTSTSKKRGVAEGFLSPQNQKPNNKKDAIFTFIFKDRAVNFAIDLKDISEIPSEEEVLVMPGIPFRITNVKHGNPIEIELNQLSINHLLGRK